MLLPPWKNSWGIKSFNLFKTCKKTATSTYCKNCGRLFLCSLVIFAKFRIKHSRPEPSVISASEPEVGVGRFAPLGSSVNACRTWTPFFNSDTFLLFFIQIFKPATSTYFKKRGRILLCSPIIIYKFRIKHSRPEPSVISASEPEVGVGRFAPLGSSVNACRTWAPFFNSDTFLLFFN